MQPPKFKYYLIVGTTEYLLPNAPKGWDENLIEWKRSPTYHGMVRSLTLPMDFVKDGAKLLKQRFAADGVEARVKVRIEELIPKTWNYEVRYEGALDFSTYEDTGVIVTVSAIDDGIEAMVNANEDQKYTISLDVPEALTVAIPPIPLVESTLFNITSDANKVLNDFFPTMDIVINERKSVGASTKAVGVLESSPPIFSTNPSWFIRPLTDTTVTSNYRGPETANPVGFLNFVVSNISTNQTFTFDISLYNSAGTKLKTFYSESVPPSTQLSYRTCQLDFAVDVVQGEVLFLYCDVSPNTNSINAVGFVITQGNMELEYNTISPSTTTKALRPYDVFKQLIKQMNGGVDYPTASRYLNNTRAKNALMTSGDALRGLEGATIITTFKDFFQSYYADGCIGFGVENKTAIIESFDYFYKPIQSAKIEDLPSGFPTVTPAGDYLYCRVKVGYDDPTYDQLNGKDEVCSTQYYKLPLTRIDKELDLVSRYRADIHGIEIARINLDGRTSADSSKGDNEVFLLKVNDEALIETAAEYGSVTGVLTGPQTYNFDLWPKHMLLRHGRFLASILDKRDGAEIKFTSGLKNYTAASTGDGKTIVENGDIEVGSLGEKIFLPYYMSIETDYPVDMLTMMDKNPTGYIEFPYNGKQWRGYNESGTVDISRRSKREFKLLLTPDMKLSNLP